MNPQSNRIYFLNNPYPNGHAITAFVWSGRIDEEENLWFDFHLKTDKYYAEDDSDDTGEPESDWESKTAWGNFHNCTISSTNWGGNKGIRISRAGEKLDFDRVIENELVADSLPLRDDYEDEDLAFLIYLLGHDSCANHRIKITKQANGFDIEWIGKIALSYAGDYEFKHDFRAFLKGVKFDGFHYPKSWSVEQATEIFSRNMEDFKDYEFVDLNPKSNKREYKLGKIEK